MSEKPDDLELIATGTEYAFEHRKTVLVIGLTGRTGSGCTTVADILAKKDFKDVRLPDLPNQPTDHEQRKNRIIRHWLLENWEPFTKIHVSHIIALFAIQEDPSNFFEFLKANLDQTNPLESERELYEKAHEQASRHRKVLEAITKHKPQQIREAHTFYFQVLPEIAQKMKVAISAHQPGGYTTVFQGIGDNLRRSGNPFGPSVNNNSLFVIPQTIERLFNLGRTVNRLDERAHDYFVIDALRHPFEILYCRERLPQFYALAINTEEHLRRSRLLTRNYRVEEIEDLDAKEYPNARALFRKKEPLKGYDRFVSQDIQACLDHADIFISNAYKMGDEPEFKDDEKITAKLLAQDVSRYIALMQHPGLVTPTSVERCMQTAFAARLNSGCISRQVGAVITDCHYSVKSIGWNDVPKGQVPCLLRYAADLLCDAGDVVAFSDFEIKNKEFHKTLQNDPMIASNQESVGGRHITYCFKSIFNTQEDEKNQVHTRSLHAEENAFLQIVKYGGEGIEEGFLFTTSSPCELCAKKAAQLGIKKVFYIDPYPGISSQHIFGYRKDVPDLVLFGGVIGHAYHRLYTPIMPYKDELKAIVQGRNVSNTTSSDPAGNQGTLF